MATVISWSDESGTAYVSIASTTPSYTLSSASTSITLPAVTVKANNKYFEGPKVRYQLNTDFTWTNWTAYVANNTYVSASWVAQSVATSTYFNTSNPTSKTATKKVNISYLETYESGSQGGTSFYTTKALATLTFTLNAPPTYTASQVSLDTSTAFAGITTATVSISSLSAKYGGSISSVKLTIGGQTATRTNNGDLSIKLNTVGTFTPSVTVTDSRGQVTTKTLNAITVSNPTPPTFDSTQVSYDTPYVYAGYTDASVTVSNATAYQGGTIVSSKLTIGNQTVTGAGDGTLSISLSQAGTFIPTVSLTDSWGQTTTETLDPIVVDAYSSPSATVNIERVNASGVADDEGAYGLLIVTISYVDGIGDLLEPAVSVSDGTSTGRGIISWYEDRALQTAVVWTNYRPQSPATIYGFLTGYGTQTSFNTQKSFQVSVTPEDTISTGTQIVQTLASAFYTVDFLAGGHGIAFGQPASQEGFFCNMDAHFVDKSDVMRALFDFVYPVGSYYETSDTTFDPNDTWGGTWILETEGQVHISAGTGYAISGALTNTTDGGNKDAIVPYHNHGFTNPSIPNHEHTIAHSHPTSDTSWPIFVRAKSGGTITRVNIKNGTGTQVSNVVTSTVALNSGGTYTGGSSNANSGNPTSLPATTGGSVAYAGTNGNTTDANLQPYIVVNRWHRTA